MFCVCYSIFCGIYVLCNIRYTSPTLPFSVHVDRRCLPVNIFRIIYNNRQEISQNCLFIEFRPKFYKQIHQHSLYPIEYMGEAVEIRVYVYFWYVHWRGPPDESNKWFGKKDLRAQMEKTIKKTNEDENQQFDSRCRHKKNGNTINSGKWYFGSSFCLLSMAISAFFFAFWK